MWQLNSHKIYKWVFLTLNMNIEKVLERVGLDQKEQKVYLTLLKIGLARAAKISRESGIERRTVYEVLERLRKKDLVSSILQKGVLEFKAMNPKQLLENLKETQRQYQEVLPQLELMASLPKEEVKIPVFQRYQGACETGGRWGFCCASSVHWV